MKRLRIDYTIYSPNDVPGEGECWDFETLRGAKRKAVEFGVGALIVRNFNKDQKINKGGEICSMMDWWQSSFCWVWDGLEFRKAYSVLEARWVVPDHHWFEQASYKKTTFCRLDSKRPIRHT